jgi:CRP-like cAMP-binding protein
MPAVLSQVPLFSGLPPEACDRLEAQVSRRDYPPQTVIVKEGGAGDAAFVILNGLVAVRRRDKDSGLEFTLTELKPGEMFGEMALLTGKPRTATVVALEPTTCAVRERANFEQVLRSHPMLAMFLTAVMAERLERANQRTGVDFINLSKMKVDPRVLTLLPTALINQHHIVPVSFCNNRLTLAMTNPNNVVAFDDVRRVIKGVMIEPVAVSDEDFRRFMSTTYVDAMKTTHSPSASAVGTAAQKGARSPAKVEPKPEKSAPTVTVDLL